MQVIRTSERDQKIIDKDVETYKNLISSSTYEEVYRSIFSYVCSSGDLVDFAMNAELFEFTSSDGVQVDMFIPKHEGTAPFIVNHFRSDDSIVAPLREFAYWPVARDRNTFVVNNEKVTSISKVLSHVFEGEFDFVADWKKRVGEAEANRIAREASTRGTALHHKLEDFLSNISVDLTFTDEMTDEQKQYAVFIHRLFNQIRPFLARNLTKVYGLEVPLVSELLKAGGRLDLLCEYNKLLTLADFKSSTKVIPRNSDKIRGYFAQMIFYARILKELTGKEVKQVLLLVATEAGIAQEIILKSDSDEWKEIEEWVVDRVNKFQPVFVLQEAAAKAAREAKKKGVIPLNESEA